ncbi:MAG: CopG family ribbon-helix-helix protein, partial [Patescibacteria group bacterium]
TCLYKPCIFNYIIMMRTLNISLPKALIDEADRIAKRQASSRSELIRESIRAYVLRTKLLDQAFKVGTKKAKKFGLKKEEDVYKFLQR